MIWKGHCHEIFHLRYFHKPSFPGPDNPRIAISNFFEKLHQYSQFKVRGNIFPESYIDRGVIGGDTNNNFGNFRKIKNGPPQDIQEPGGRWPLKKAWRKKSCDTSLPSRRLLRKGVLRLTSKNLRGPLHWCITFINTVLANFSLYLLLFHWFCCVLSVSAKDGWRGWQQWAFQGGAEGTGATKVSRRNRSG